VATTIEDLDGMAKKVLDNLALSLMLCGRTPIELTPAQRAEFLEPHSTQLAIASVQLRELLNQAKLRGAASVHEEMVQASPEETVEHYSTEDQ